MKDSDNLHSWSSRFVSMITHEIRTPLTTIISFAQTLIEEQSIPKEERNYYLGIIEKQGKRINHFLGELSEIMKIESGSVINPEEFEINRLLLSIINSPESITDKPVELVLAETSCIIRADYDLLQTAIRILLIYLDNKCDEPLSLQLEHSNEIARITIICRNGDFTEKEIHELFDTNRQLLLSRSEIPVKNRPVYAAAVIRGHKGSIWISPTPGGGVQISLELLK
ncbi:MAG: HAMP domain-containing histidine kinase [Chitinispirillaceae bacterium]|nr:HAMP domain-containing histidine kinase [Chitinispirillaceae bacterium]